METELERMVVRLIGEGSSFQNMMKEAVQTTQRAAQDTAESTKRMEQSASASWKNMAEAATAAFSAFGAYTFLKSALDMFSSMEQGQIRLQGAIRASGRDVQVQMDQYRAFADVMRQTAGVNKDATIQLLQRAETMGAQGPMAEKMVKDALALQAALGGEANHWMMVAKAVAEGNAAMIHHIPQLRGIHDPAQKLAEAQKLINSGLGIQKELMNSTSAVMERFTGSIKLITKQFGQYVAEGIKPAVKFVTEIASEFGKLEEGTKRLIVQFAMATVVILGMGPALLKLWTYIKPVLGLITSMFSPLGLLIGAFVIATAALMDFMRGGDRTEVMYKAMMKVWNVVKDVGAAILKGLNIAGLGATWTEIGETIYNAIIKVTNWIEDNKQTFMQWGYEIGGILKGVFDFIKDAGVAVLNMFSDASNKMANGTELDWDRILGFVTNTLTYLRVMFQNFPLTWNWAIANIKATALETWDTITNWIAAQMMKVVGGFHIMAAMLKVGLIGVKDFYAVAFELIWVDIQTFYAKSKAGWAGAWAYITTVSSAFFEWLPNRLERTKLLAQIVWAEMKAGAQASMNPFGPSVKDAMLEASKDLRAQLESLQAVNPFNNLGDKAKKAAADAVKQFADEIKALQNRGDALATGPNPLDGLLARMAQAGVDVRDQYKKEIDRINALRSDASVAARAEADRLSAELGKKIGDALSNRTPIASAAGRNLGTHAGGEFNKAMGNEIKKFNAANYFSAEARARITEYLSHIRAAAAGTPLPSSSGSGAGGSGSSGSAGSSSGGAAAGFGAGLGIPPGGPVAPSFGNPSSYGPSGSAGNNNNGQVVSKLTEIAVRIQITNRYLLALTLVQGIKVEVADLPVP